MNSRTEQFLNKYRELENLIDARFDLSDNESAIAFLLRRPEYQSLREQLDFCREVRNLLTHNPKVGGVYPVEPSQQMVDLLDRIVKRIRAPLLAKHIFIPRHQVTCRSMNDLVLPAMEEMNERVYTNIPIMKDGIVVGAFSENTLLCCLLDEQIMRIDSNTRFRDFAKYLPLDCHRAESYRFIGKNTTADEIEMMFAEATKNSDRIGLLFVTETGKPTERLLGIISAWDMAGVD